MWKVYLRGSERARTGGSTPPPPYAAPLHVEGSPTAEGVFTERMAAIRRLLGTE